MSTTTHESPPWCAGRRYANAPAEFKVWCTGRPPPFWWLVRFEDFATGLSILNAELIFPAERNAWGYNPWCEWWHRTTLVPDGCIKVEWAHFGGDIRQRRLLVNVQTDFTLLQQIQWGLGPEPPVDDWYVYDDIELPEVYRSPTWGFGAAPRCWIRIGEYQRLPGMVCRQPAYP